MKEKINQTLCGSNHLITPLSKSGKQLLLANSRMIRGILQILEVKFLLIDLLLYILKGNIFQNRCHAISRIHESSSQSGQNNCVIKSPSPPNQQQKKFTYSTQKQKNSTLSAQISCQKTQFHHLRRANFQVLKVAIKMSRPWNLTKTSK